MKNTIASPDRSDVVERKRCMVLQTNNINVWDDKFATDVVFLPKFCNKLSGRWSWQQWRVICDWVMHGTEFFDCWDTWMKVSMWEKQSSLNTCKHFADAAVCVVHVSMSWIFLSHLSKLHCFHHIETQCLDFVVVSFFQSLSQMSQSQFWWVSIVSLSVSVSKSLDCLSLDFSLSHSSPKCLTKILLFPHGNFHPFVPVDGSCCGWSCGWHLCKETEQNKPIGFCNKPFHRKEWTTTPTVHPLHHWRSQWSANQSLFLLWVSQHLLDLGTRTAHLEDCSEQFWVEQSPWGCNSHIWLNDCSARHTFIDFLVQSLGQKEPIFFQLQSHVMFHAHACKWCKQLLDFEGKFKQC